MVDRVMRPAENLACMVPTTTRKSVATAFDIIIAF